MGYELSTVDIYGLASKLNSETRVKGKELFFSRCPYCNGGDAPDKDTFSINLETGQFKCFRVSCGKQGHFVQMARDFEYPLEYTRDRRLKDYRKLPQKQIAASEPAIAYMESRGISRATCEGYKLTSRNDNAKVLVFPFLDEGGRLQFVKYRNTVFRKGKDKNKEWCEAGTMPILFGMWQCEDSGTLVITEGQIDSLSLSDAGIKNAVSVPTGALGFTWLENCWEWVTRFSEVVVFGDYENGKITLVDELSKRLPMPVRVVCEADYLGEKDANAILQKYGKQALVDAVERARIQPINHIKELADVETVDLNTLEHIETGIPEIDRIIGGLYFGQVTLLTGKRGEGKSTFMGQLIVEAIDQGYKTLAYSGELTDYQFKRWIDFQAAGPDMVITNKNAFGDEIYSLHYDTVVKLNKWYRGMAYVYDNGTVDDGDELESLLVTVEKAVCRYGIQLVCLDNLMTAMDLDTKDDLYQAQSRFVYKLKQLAVRHRIAVLLVAHPRKTQNAATIDDVAGSGDIGNRVDVSMCYSRPPSGDESCDGMVSILKDRNNGRVTRSGDEVRLIYSTATKRITSMGQRGPRIYGWAKDEFVTMPETEDLPF